MVSFPNRAPFQGTLGHRHASAAFEGRNNPSFDAKDQETEHIPEHLSVITKPTSGMSRRVLVFLILDPCTTRVLGFLKPSLAEPYNQHDIIFVSTSGEADTYHVLARSLHTFERHSLSHSLRLRRSSLDNALAERRLRLRLSLAGEIAAVEGGDPKQLFGLDNAQVMQLSENRLSACNCVHNLEREFNMVNVSMSKDE